MPKITNGSPTYATNVDISNCNISNLGVSGASSVFRGDSFRLNNVKVNDTYLGASAIDNAYIAAISGVMDLRNVKITSNRGIRVNSSSNNHHTGTSFFGRNSYVSSPNAIYRFHGENTMSWSNTTAIFPNVVNHNSIYFLSPGVSMFADVDTSQKPSTINFIYKAINTSPVETKLLTIVSTDPVASSSGVVIGSGDSASTSGSIATPWSWSSLLAKGFLLLKISSL